MKKYFYSNGTDKEGPFSFDELKNANINAETLIWYEGLEDWKLAKDLEDMIPIFEIIPPPFIETNNKNKNFIKIYPEQNKASTGWIIAGFIFSILGGFLGVAIGANYAFGKYDKQTKSIGWVILVLGVIGTSIWKSM